MSLHPQPRTWTYHTLHPNLRVFLTHPSGNPGANLKSISRRCLPILVACAWELTEETIHLPLGCLQGGLTGLRVPSQDQAAEDFYIILSGSVQKVVESADPSKPGIPIAQPLAPSAFFGEKVLLYLTERIN